MQVNPPASPLTGRRGGLRRFRRNVALAAKQ